MIEQFTEAGYESMIEALFNRFPSFQKSGVGAYKPGVGNMLFFDQLLGHPHTKYKIIHIAGTNGKGSVSNMLASVLTALGNRVGLYTSPHIMDFRERMRVCDPSKGYALISKGKVWDFISRWQDTFDHLDMSFFEITTSMAFDWFASEKVDYVILETGLGGRLDSTNIVNPQLSIITNIGLDHCDLLGDTLQEIAFEKAGIIKPNVPVVVGESAPEIDDIFERKVLYTNIMEPSFVGDRTRAVSLLRYADKYTPYLQSRSDEILRSMDLRGDYQAKNLRTVLAALDVLCSEEYQNDHLHQIVSALINTSARTGFGARWETICEQPYIICDIGHNEHGLKYNFSQLKGMLEKGECTHLIIIYGSVSDKDIDAVIPLMPLQAEYIFTQAKGKRALDAECIYSRYLDRCREESADDVKAHVCADACAAFDLAYKLVEKMSADDPSSRPLIYVGGSTYVVSEFLACFNDEIK